VVLAMEWEWIWDHLCKALMVPMAVCANMLLLLQEKRVSQTGFLRCNIDKCRFTSWQLQ